MRFGHDEIQHTLAAPPPQSAGQPLELSDMKHNRAAQTLRFYDRLRRGLIGAYALVAAGFCAAATWYVVQDRAERLAAATQNASTLARALDEHVRRTFNAVDVLLFDIAADIAVAGGVPHVDEARLHRQLRAKEALLPQVRAMFVYGPDSVLYAGSTRLPTLRIDGTLLEHVSAHRLGGAYSLFVGRPHSAPVSGQPSIPVTRRIPHASGQFGGVVGASVDPTHFSAFYTDLGLAPGESSALLRTDGILLSRFPESALFTPGLDVSNSPVFTDGLRLHTVGTVRSVSAVDGRERVIAFRQIPDLPLIVMVAQTVDEILVPWRRNAAFIGTGVAGALAVLLALLWLTLRQIGRRTADARRLLEAEERYRTLVEHAPIGIAQHADGIVEYANPELARIYGAATPRQLVGREVIELVYPDDRERLRARLTQQSDAPAAAVPLVFRIRRDDGTEAVVETHAVATRQGGRWVEQVLVRDVTEARRAAEEVRQLNETLEEKVRTRTAELEAANEELESFSYSVSHDLRAPLRAIAGFSTILRTEHSGMAGGGTALIGRIEAAAKRMGALIEDLLSLARVSRKEMHRGDVELSRLAREIANELAEANPGRAVDLRIVPGLYAYADPSLIRIVLQNLLANAWKYTSKRAQAIVEFGAETRGDRECVFYVRDNGAGFEMRHSAGLFRPFYRLHSDRDYEGTGIGLATVDRIIRRHGGRIWAEATLDRGATFRFALPEPPATRTPPKARLDKALA